MSEPYQMSEGELQVLEELSQMRVDDPEGYRAIVADLRGDSGADEDLARRHAEHMLDRIQANRDAASAPLQELLQRAYRDTKADQQ